jgi:hypothetical protein
MIAIEERTSVTALEARQAALRRELFQVNQEIHETEQAQARLEECIRILEQMPRQAA